MKKPSSYTMLWTLLSVALIIFIAVSFLGDEETWPIRLAGFKDALTKERSGEVVSPLEDVPGELTPENPLIAEEGDTIDSTSQPADLAVAVEDMTPVDTGIHQSVAGTVERKVTSDSTSSAMASAQRTAEEPDTRPINPPDTTVGHVLIFGDSMTGLIARRLGEYGKQNGYMVHSVTVDGASIAWWGGKVEPYIEQHRPDFIFVVLGSNEINVRDASKKASDVKNLVARFGGTPYVWIGPPIWTDNKSFDDMMKNTLPHGTYFVSDMELERGKDHIHPTPKAGVIWTDAVMEWMRRSPHPIKSERPTGGGSSHDRTYIPMKARKK